MDSGKRNVTVRVIVACFAQAIKRAFFGRGYDEIYGNFT